MQGYRPQLLAWAGLAPDPASARASTPACLLSMASLILLPLLPSSCGAASMAAGAGKPIVKCGQGLDPWEERDVPRLGRDGVPKTRRKGETERILYESNFCMRAARSACFTRQMPMFVSGAGVAWVMLPLQHHIPPTRRCINTPFSSAQPPPSHAGGCSHDPSRSSGLELEQVKCACKIIRQAEHPHKPHQRAVKVSGVSRYLFPEARTRDRQHMPSTARHDPPEKACTARGDILGGWWVECLSLCLYDLTQPN
jgi:hypothetical protein